MSFTLKNFGAVAEATIQIKPLTIIVGKNSIGKSHLLQSYYAWRKATKKIFSNIFRPFVLDYYFHLTEGYYEFLDLEIRDPMKLLGKKDYDKLQEQIVGKKKKLTLDSAICQRIINQSSSLFNERFSRELIKIKKNGGLLLTNEIESTFGTTIDKMNSGGIRIEFKSPLFSSIYETKEKEPQNPLYESIFPTIQVPIKYARIYFNFQWEKAEVRLEEKFIPLAKVYKEYPSVIERKEKKFTISKIDENDDKYLKTIINYVIKTYINIFLREIYLSNELFTSKIFYLAAARSGMLQAHRSLASTMMKLSRFAGLRRTDFPLLPGSQIDFIIDFLQYNENKTREYALLSEEKNNFDDKLTKLIKFLEKDIIHGTLKIKEQQTGYPEIFLNQTGRDFELHTTSSMIAELAPIFLLLKYFEVSANDTIIIEEPESHLHPSLTSKMAKLIARAVNYGLNIMVTTHSDFFLKELDNLIRISNLSSKNRKELGFADEDALTPEKVSLYLLKQDTEDYSKIEQIPICNDGFETEFFDKVINELYEKTIQIDDMLQMKEKD